MKGNTKFKKLLGIVIAVLLLGVIYPLLDGASGDGNNTPGNDGIKQVGQDVRDDQENQDTGGSPASQDSQNIRDDAPDQDHQDGIENFYTFRNEKYLVEHFEKHGSEFGYVTKEEYEAGANRVIASEEALHKTEAEDGDYIYYLESSNEIVFLSVDGNIRTYFKPQDGIKYYERQ